MRPIVLPFLLSFAALEVSTDALQAQAPPIFQTLGYEAAHERARSEDKLLVLDAMTSWCGPCKRMDATTWVDPELVAWMQQNTIAIQLDMDEHVQLKESLEIKAFPTIVVFKQGEEFDRVVGLRTAPQMMTWLEGARANRTELDRVLADVQAIRALPEEQVDIGRRMHLAQSLLTYDQVDLAREEFLWLWTRIPELAPQMHSQRWDRLRWPMRDLARKDTASWRSFAALRDSVEPSPNAESWPANELRDWIELNLILGQEDMTAAWAARVAETPAGRAALQTWNQRLFGVLIEHEQWRAAGLALVDPAQRVRNMGENLGAYDLPSTEAPASDRAAPKTIPAIPMTGGMKPATPAKPKVMPAIPMKSGMAPAKAKPAVPMKAKPRPEVPIDPKARPAIPMKAETRPAVPMKAESRPAIPMSSGARPAIPMTATPQARPAQPETEEDIAREVRRRLTVQFREVSGQYYAALLAANRQAEAEAVANLVFEYADDAKSRVQLVSQAIRAGQLERDRARHLRWLDEASW